MNVPSKASLKERASLLVREFRNAREDGFKDQDQVRRLSHHVEVSADLLHRFAEIQEDGAMKHFPSKAELYSLAEALRSGAPPVTEVNRNVAHLNKAATILDNLAAMQEEKPKVESLLEAAKRYYTRSGMSPGASPAHLCALVLRRVDELADLLRLHLGGMLTSDVICKVHEHRNTNARMLAGSGE